MNVIYHITTRTAWEDAVAKGFYEAPSLAEEGFIHCAQEAQVQGVLQRYFRNQNNLVKLTIDTALLKAPLVFEWSPSTADTFPHVYGPINTNAVIAVTDIASTP